jgi:hypothetical protein
MKAQEPEKPPKTDDESDRMADEKALLAGILNGMKPAGSPMSTPSQARAVAGAALGMPMFHSAPPGIGSSSCWACGGRGGQQPDESALGDIED